LVADSPLSTLNILDSGEDTMPKYTALAAAVAPFHVRRETLIRHWNTDARIGSRFDLVAEAATYEGALAAREGIEQFDEDGYPLDDETCYAIVDAQGREVLRPDRVRPGVDNDDGLPF